MRRYFFVAALLGMTLVSACAGQRSSEPMGGQQMGGMQMGGQQTGGMHMGGGMQMGQQHMAGAAPGNMDERMRAMQEMHSKMMAAKTPEERRALMAEHQKVMREGMAAMHDSMGMMQRSGQCKNPAAMQQHQQMMQMMMQMMAESPDTSAPVPRPD